MREGYRKIRILELESSCGMKDDCGVSEQMLCDNVVVVLKILTLLFFIGVGAFFVKPANSGSSVGIQKVTKLQSLPRALAEASRYDTKLLVETAIDAREIEVAVLGNEEPEASLPGEIRTRRDFYDYEAKYVDESTELLVPAPLSESESDAVRDLAIRAYRALEGAGLGRVDFLMERSTGTFYLNELNSLPGFTEVSMYPRLWEATGLPYPQLLDRLIELAIDRHRKRAALETTFRKFGH
jgi:D-alanine-D-alanine ligase